MQSLLLNERYTEMQKDLIYSTYIFSISKIIYVNKFLSKKLNVSEAMQIKEITETKHNMKIKIEAFVQCDNK